MKRIKLFFSDKGVTLVEMTVTLGILGILGLIIVNVSRYADRQTKIQMEDVQTMISKLGGSKVMSKDLSFANPSFNYINLLDDNGKPFFVLAKNEFCQGATAGACSREIKLTIPDGQTVSNPFYLISVKGFNKEVLKFAIPVENVFSPTGSYLSINHATNSIEDIKKSVTHPEFPWTKQRLIFLSSNNDFYDCNNKIDNYTGGPCTITCSVPGTCNYVAKREYKMLGVVSNDEKELNFHTVSMRPNLFQTNYNICNVNDSMGCSGTISTDLTVPKNFFEKLPFAPGMDNGATIAPVELIRYHLERPAATSPDHEIRLFRSMATLSGTTLSFERAFILMTGVQSIVFSRPNISNPSIEYKLIKARAQKSIK